MALKKIVFVEDDYGILEVARFIFEKAGYDIALFASANSLLLEELVPDAFILDKQLPDMDGLDLCRLLKSKPATQRVPVLMLSANPHIKQLAASAGADAVIEKPFDLNELLQTISELTA